jgi:hypothetical protein
MEAEAPRLLDRALDLGQPGERVGEGLPGRGRSAEAGAPEAKAQVALVQLAAEAQGLRAALDQGGGARCPEPGGLEARPTR